MALTPSNESPEVVPPVSLVGQGAASQATLPAVRTAASMSQPRVVEANQAVLLEAVAVPRPIPKGVIPNTTPEWLESIEAIYLQADGALEFTVESRMAKDTLLLHRTIPVLESAIHALERIDAWDGGLVDAPDKIGAPNPREIAASALDNYQDLMAEVAIQGARPATLSAFSEAQTVAAGLLKSNGELQDKARRLGDEMERLRDELGALRDRHLLTTNSLHERTVALNQANHRIEQLQKEPPPAPAAPAVNKIVMPPGPDGAWVEVNDLSIHVIRTEDGVSISAYAMGRETEDAIDEIEISNQEAREYRYSEPDPDPGTEPEAQRRPFPVSAPGVFHPGYKAWVEIANQDHDNEDARDLMLDAINNGRTMLEPLSPFVYFAALNDERPGVVDVAIQGLVTDHQTPQSKNFYRYMLESVFQDASRLSSQDKGWASVAVRAAYEVMRIDRGVRLTATTPEQQRFAATAKEAYMVGGGL